MRKNAKKGTKTRNAEFHCNISNKFGMRNAALHIDKWGKRNAEKCGMQNSIDINKCGMRNVK